MQEARKPSYILWSFITRNILFIQQKIHQFLANYVRSRLTRVWPDQTHWSAHIIDITLIFSEAKPRLFRETITTIIVLRLFLNYTRATNLEYIPRGWWLAYEITHSPPSGLLKILERMPAWFSNWKLIILMVAYCFSRPTTTISFGNGVWVDSSNRFESRQCIIANGRLVSDRFA